MNIAINASAATYGGGFTYLNNLLQNIQKLDKSNQYYIFINKKNLLRLDNIKAPNLRFIPLTIPSICVLLRLVWEQILLPLYLKKHKIDVVLCPFNIAPIFGSTKKALVIQNIQPFFKEIIKKDSFFEKIRLYLLNFLIFLSAKKAGNIIFFSKYSQNMLINKFKNQKNKTNVIYNGKNEIFKPIKNKKTIEKIKNKFNITGKYIFCVSSIYRYHNLYELLMAFDKNKNNLNEDLKLVLVGKIYDKKYFKEIKKYINKNNLNKKVIFLENIPHKELPYLYSGCLFFIFPSNCETFGLVLLEAMACGAPIACSNKTAMPEICRDAAVYFDPNNINDISEKILQISNNQSLRKKLTKKSLKRAKDFSWKKSTSETLKVLKRVYN